MDFSKPERPRPSAKKIAARGEGRSSVDTLADELRQTAREMRRNVVRAHRKVIATRDKIEEELRETAAEMKRRVAGATRKAKATAGRFEDEVRETAAEVKRRVDSIEEDMRARAAEVKRRIAVVRRYARMKAGRFSDEARFLKTWIENPLTTGAVAPSSPDLARVMAGYVDPSIPGRVIELGPGTGPVTEALVARGIAPERLLLVEYDPEFCELLRRRYPAATVVRGDAYALSRTLSGMLDAPVGAIVSSLPLFTRPPAERLALLADAFGLARALAPFVQFTYAAVSPMPLKSGGFTAEASKRVWRNVPPARVWVYRRA